jgi:hypothetical protein
MEQWEYLPTYIEANAKDKKLKEFLKQQIPDKKKPPRYSPEAMMPALDELGQQGWELLHMEPVAGTGNKGDVLFGGGRQWSNVYFCVFKRRKAGSFPQVMPINSEGQAAFSTQQQEQQVAQQQQLAAYQHQLVQQLDYIQKVIAYQQQSQQAATQPTESGD